ncbi:DNA adenine methylase [Pararhodobacter zhoushanensis]|uniref:site-specific DNA-methyltransferase (adenine-specific) n=1 Tax=Pararhodobacter zhoushanensis TaxID=2479545 RepID=A0ABT3H2X4_9RHOB|nr:DNA adenine methylase [Pararhodobacter zhoushanensis]MCW1934132.1 DNA adenine methylase [Pararhodobacter zhoushanensis]
MILLPKKTPNPAASAADTQTVTATRPAAPWLGGKRNLAKRLCALIDADARAGRHTTYAEPFVGMGGIFLRRTVRPRAEFINDRQRDVHTLFRILQEHYVAFLDLLRFQITTQANFERLVVVDPDTLTDLQRAARFLFLQRTAFGGKISGRNFGISTDRPARFNLTTLEPDLEALHERLSGVTVTCMDYAEFIDRIDRPGVLFYLDPPYYGSEGDYGRALFSRERFVELAEQLGRLKGRFMLSLNDVPEVREIFGRFEMTEVKTSYSIAAKGAVPERGELLIVSAPTAL